jgi:hypothetical protein
MKSKHISKITGYGYSDGEARTPSGKARKGVKDSRRQPITPTPGKSVKGVAGTGRTDSSKSNVTKKSEVTKIMKVHSGDVSIYLSAKGVQIQIRVGSGFFDWDNWRTLTKKIREVREKEFTNVDS